MDNLKTITDAISRYIWVRRGDVLFHRPQSKVSDGRPRKNRRKPLSAAEKMRRYRERLKMEHPEKYEEMRLKNLKRIKLAYARSKKSTSQVSAAEAEKLRKM